MKNQQKIEKKGKKFPAGAPTCDRGPKIWGLDRCAWGGQAPLIMLNFEVGVAWKELGTAIVQFSIGN